MPWSGLLSFCLQYSWLSRSGNRHRSQAAEGIAHCGNCVCCSVGDKKGACWSNRRDLPVACCCKFLGLNTRCYSFSSRTHTRYLSGWWGDCFYWVLHSCIRASGRRGLNRKELTFGRNGAPTVAIVICLLLSWLPLILFGLEELQGVFDLLDVITTVIRSCSQGHVAWQLENITSAHTFQVK